MTMLIIGAYVLTVVLISVLIKLFPPKDTFLREMLTPINPKDFSGIVFVCIWPFWIPLLVAFGILFALDRATAWIADGLRGHTKE